MGADFYEAAEEKCANKEIHQPNVGIGRGTIIKNAIIDMNARIGSDCRIGYGDTALEDGDYGNYSVRDKIIVIPPTELGKTKIFRYRKPP